MMQVNQPVALVDDKEKWCEPCVHTESTLHQLSPYIGKLKSSIARDLIEKYSKEGDLIVDPFSGSGTVPLESCLLGRRAFAADISPYAKILTLGKLKAPKSLEETLDRLDVLLDLADERKNKRIKKVPDWISKFFHPKTLKETLNFAAICREHEEYFFMACLLGILHHQRPGFLSYPSSHLVPYLRDKKYPREAYPELYSYRELKPRITAKVLRAYKRMETKSDGFEYLFQKQSLENQVWPESFDCLITSPPYMNTLDYGRDNRLRLWFSEPNYTEDIDRISLGTRIKFVDGIDILAKRTDAGLKVGGYAVLVVGEKSKRNNKAHPSEIVKEIFKSSAKTLNLVDEACDNIPDVRRARKELKGTKVENILVYHKE